MRFPLRALGLLAGAALAAAPASALAAGKTYTVVVQNLAFGPLPTHARVGDVIQWVNQDIFAHSATAKDKSFDVELPPGGQGRTVLKRAGKIAYVCKYHPGMTGVLDVRR